MRITAEALPKRQSKGKNTKTKPKQNRTIPTKKCAPTHAMLKGMLWFLLSSPFLVDRERESRRKADFNRLALTLQSQLPLWFYLNTNSIDILTQSTTSVLPSHSVFPFTFAVRYCCCCCRCYSLFHFLLKSLRIKEESCRKKRVFDMPWSLHTAPGCNLRKPSAVCSWLISFARFSVLMFVLVWKVACENHSKRFFYGRNWNRNGTEG